MSEQCATLTGISSEPSRVRTASSVLAAFDHGPTAPRAVIGTGFEPLDSALDGGFRSGQLVVVGGIPGVGKTVLTMQWARTMAASGHTTLYVCYEHDHESLVMRLLSLELGSLAEDTGDHSHESRSSLRAIASGEGRLDDESDGNLELRAARARIDAYGKRLHLLASGGIRADIGDLATAMQSTGASVLFVDYLQKVPSFSGGGEVAGTHAASALKDLALGHNVLVVATSAAASRGLTGHRVRVADMRGASAIAYEADVILMVNEKHRVVSRLHRDFDPTAVERFRTQVVVSIDKNRSGPAGIDMQFRKDLAHFRFSEQGAHVEEHLVDRDDALDDARSG